ncbi:hypothetical protein QR680_007324 [Steinernema hermaphroditum]|uniref:non-specific serine/threonine protein kinase n=1 Tax=Steinernema hermaphroditum TaxID=289476 RepID=A0AA39ICW2_9BILA|nr:hypothetical protein QR680_007324 [Steinernema hermaphroditum]
MDVDQNPLLFSAPPALPARNPYRDRYRDVSTLQFLKTGDNTEEILNNSAHYNPEEPGCYLSKCFHIGAVLGGGSFGVVIEAVCKTTGRRFAVKRSKEAFRTPSDRHFKMKELRRFEMITPHPNILELHGAWQEDRHLHILTEFCVSPLSVFCRSPMFTKAVLFHCSLDVTTAVDHVHKHGLIHVDIKPENVLVTREGLCKLADFGASYIPQEDKDIWDDGDCRYLSHDLMNNCPTVMSDVFSLGITLFEVATQWTLPKNGEQWSALRTDGCIEGILKERCPEMAEIVGAAVRDDPNARASTTQLVEALRRLCSFHERPQLNWEWEPPQMPLPPAVRAILPRPPPPTILATPPSTPPRENAADFVYETPDYFILTPRAVQSERKPVRPLRLKFDD